MVGVVEGWWGKAGVDDLFGGEKHQISEAGGHTRTHMLAWMVLLEDDFPFTNNPL